MYCHALSVASISVTLCSCDNAKSHTDVIWTCFRTNTSEGWYCPAMTLIIGHRGASKAFKENTIEAIQGAREAGADWVELDIRRSLDGEIVVHHDPHTEASALIAATKASDLPSYIPTLAEALEACGDMGVNIEIKNEEDEEDFDPEHQMVPRTIEVARAKMDRAKTLITSFDMGAINAVHDSDPAMPTGLLTSDPIGAEVSVGRAAAHDHVAINPSDEIITPRWVAAAEEAGLAVYVWTVDDHDRMVELAEWGVDGIITNVPAIAVQALR